MFQRLVFTLATAGSLIGFAVLYSAAMRPIVVIPVRAEPKVNEPEFTEATRPAENVRVAAKYIPFSEWATESKYMLRADQAFVYTQEWERAKENLKRVTFKPFAMVWLTNDKDGNEQAVSVASDEATLEFASEFDEKNQNPGRVVVAILGGRVKLAGPDGLAVEGQDFFFEEAALSLYTTNPVRFQFQSSKGLASQMRMKLIPAEGLPSLDRPHVYGIESVRLIGGDNPVKLFSKLPQGKVVRPVQLKCAGDLVYTVDSSTAVFNDDVQVWAGSKGDYDLLNCHTLTMQFVPQKKGTSKPTDVDASESADDLPTDRDFQKFETNLEFSWLEAEAAPGKSVKIHSQAYGIAARMSRLTYNAETQMLSMNSDDSKVPVSVTRNGSNLHAPRIEAQLDLAAPNPLPSLLCVGKGELTYVDEKTDRPAFRALWKKQLSKKFDPEANLDLIELDDDAVFGQPDRMTGLSADLIKIWLVPIAFGLPGRGDESARESSTPEPEPKRLLASGAVVFKSPQLVIERTNELDIQFDEDGTAFRASAGRASVSQFRRERRLEERGVRKDRLEPGSTILNTQTKQSRSALSSSALTLTSAVEARRPPLSAAYANSGGRIGSKSPQVGFANIPAIPDGRLGPAVEIPSETSNEPIVVRANRIFVRLQRIADQAEPAVRDVNSEGKVTVTQERKPGEKPMRLQGDRVDVKTESVKGEIVHVLGTPALIHDRGFEIEGRNIHLDRGSNRAWVSGGGRLSLEIPADTKIPGTETNLQRNLIVRWDESMNFDGLAAAFLGRVEAKLGLGKMHCEQMVVRLANRLSFQADSFEANPTLQSVHCRENVSFENSAYLEKNVVEVYRGRVSEFTVNYASGDVVAQGPGQIRTWQRQKKKNERVLDDAIQANRPILVEVTAWDYIGVQFEGRLKGRFDGQTTGHLTRQEATVNDRVEVVYGPVKSPSELIDSDNLPSRAGTIRCDKLQVINHPAGNHPTSDRMTTEYRELIGTGNTEIEGLVDGRRFTASADKIIYDGSKGLYVLRADGRQTARLNGVGLGNVTGQTITFNPDPKLKYLHVVHATEGQGSH